MRQITVKYQGDCRKCGKPLEVGESAIYERRVGLFCLTCKPTDTEEIREYRQEGANRKADRYDEWAGKREKDAKSKLNSYPSIRHDWAFITQPGKMSLREKMNKSDDRAVESLNIANKMRCKAESLRHIRVKGDAEKRWQRVRDLNMLRLHVGDMVDTGIYGVCKIIKFNKKTVKVEMLRTGTRPFTVDLAFLSPVKQEIEPSGKTG